MSVQFACRACADPGGCECVCHRRARRKPVTVCLAPAGVPCGHDDCLAARNALADKPPVKQTVGSK